mmetsp:Transcript_69977/g.161873  ORF Transcript_69977/g.161873 Transcript_69977/m.161873 type:complete len:262 (-) Transcript_69977:64-849(-)
MALARSTATQVTPLPRLASETPLLIYYHGNGEVVSEYTHWVDLYQKFPCTFMAFDYRAYGWSTGEAKAGCLTKDPAACMRELPATLQRHGLAWPWPAPVILMGRSLGSVVACSLVAKFPDMFDGIIVESGLASDAGQHHRELLEGCGESAEAAAALGRLRELVEATLPLGYPLGQDLMAPVGSCDGLRGYRGLVLILHGRKDSIVPLEHAWRNYQAAENARERELVEIDGDHNSCAGEAEFWRKQMHFNRKAVQHWKSQRS